MDTNFTGLVNLEYETQFFGCSSKDVKEGIENALNCKVRESVKGLVSLFKKLLDLSSDTASLVEKEIINLYQVASEEPLKILEEDIKKYFEIPSNVLLPEDQPQQIQYTEEDVKKIDEEISDLLKRVEVTKFMSAALNEEYDELNQLLDGSTTKLGEIEKTMKESDSVQQTLLNTLNAGKFQKNCSNGTS